MSGIAFVASLIYLVRARDPKYSVIEVPGFGPCLFVSPERHFRPGRHSAPWRALLLWLVPTIVLGYLGGVFFWVVGGFTLSLPPNNEFEPPGSPQSCRAAGALREFTPAARTYCWFATAQRGR